MGVVAFEVVLVVVAAAAAAAASAFVVVVERAPATPLFRWGATRFEFLLSVPHSTRGYQVWGPSGLFLAEVSGPPGQ